MLTYSATHEQEGMIQLFVAAKCPIVAESYVMARSCVTEYLVVTRRPCSDFRRPCSDFTDMLRRLINCRIIIIIFLLLLS